MLSGIKAILAAALTPYSGSVTSSVLMGVGIILVITAITARATNLPYFGNTVDPGESVPRQALLGVFGLAILALGYFGMTSPVGPSLPPIVSCNETYTYTDSYAICYGVQKDNPNEDVRPDVTGPGCEVGSFLFKKTEGMSYSVSTKLGPECITTVLNANNVRGNPVTIRVFNRTGPNSKPPNF